MPKPGDTLTYDIYVDGHAKTGPVRLFFFHYDCRIGDRLLISVRNGQAGFFTEDELATGGWRAVGSGRGRRARPGRATRSGAPR